MMISIQTRINNRTFNTIDSIDELEAAGLNRDSYQFNELAKMLADLQTPERQAMGGGCGHAGPGLHVSMKLHNVNREKFHQFTETYANFLAANFQANPEQYIGTLETTLVNMRVSILKGTFNKDSESFKQTCKALKIKHTYKAIDAFLERVK